MFPPHAASSPTRTPLPDPQEAVLALGGDGAIRNGLIYYPLYTLLCCGLLYAAFDLRHASRSVPLYAPAGDGIFSLVVFQALGETGWLHVNPRLGAPGLGDHYDFPYSVEVLDLLIVKGLLWACGDAVAAMNAYFLLGFLLSGWTCLFVLRQLGISWPISLAGALLFAFQPLHFWRATWHVFLSFYPAIPLGVLLCLWLCAERPLFFAGASGRPARGRAVAAALICMATASLGIYYAWFMGFFLVMSGLIVWLRRPRLRPPGDATVCTAIFVATVLAQVVPFVPHWLAHEAPKATTKRSPGSSQLFRLSVAEMLLPTVGHRVPALRVVEARRSIGHGADPRDEAIGARAFIQEQYRNALGVVASAGFVALCAVLFAGSSPWLARFRPIDDLARLNIAAVLLASEFGLFFEVLVPYIRAYNRIAIYIGFFAILAVALIVERLRPARPGVFYHAAVVLVTALALLDQIPSVITPDHRAAAESFARERRYGHEVEAMLPAGSMVFQLPYSDFPEGEHGYDHMKLYLHTSALRTSFGASRGSRVDAWQREVASRPVPAMIAELRRAGFAGIHLDLDLLGDEDADLKASIERELGPPALVGNDGHWAFYRLDPPKEPSR